MPSNKWCRYGISGQSLTISWKLRRLKSSLPGKYSFTAAWWIWVQSKKDSKSVQRWSWSDKYWSSDSSTVGTSGVGHGKFISTAKAIPKQLQTHYKLIEMSHCCKSGPQGIGYSCDPLKQQRCTEEDLQGYKLVLVLEKTPRAKQAPIILSIPKAYW